jgi:hypothetical protein
MVSWGKIGGISIIGLTLIGGYLYTQGVQLAVLMVLLGCMLFIPVGAVMGVFLGDIFRRCSMMRRILSKNYGVINLVQTDGKNIQRFIKNFDDDILELKNGIWIIKDGLIYIDKGEGSETKTGLGEIKYISGVPTVYLSYESLAPLSLNSNLKTAINPTNVTPSIRSWLVLKATELLNNLGKQAKIGAIIIIGLLLITAYFSYDTNQRIAKEKTGMQVQVQEIHDNYGSGAASAPQPAPKPAVAKQAPYVSQLGIPNWGAF